MKSKPNVSQIIRHLIQAVAFIFFPGIFLSVFTTLRDVVTAFLTDSFSFSGFANQLVLLGTVFLMTILWGRFFCGYLCSFGTMQELMGWISRRQRLWQRTLPSEADRIMKYVKYAVLLIVILLWTMQLPVDSTLSPWGIFGMLVSGNLTVMYSAIPTLGFAALLAILTGSFFIERFFCRYLCPLGALFALSSAHRFFRIDRKVKSCTGCRVCSRECATGVIIHNQKKVTSGECIECMRCTDVCTSAALNSNPRPVIAGTAAALVMCGLLSVETLGKQYVHSVNDLTKYEENAEQSNNSDLTDEYELPETHNSKSSDKNSSQSENGSSSEQQQDISGSQNTNIQGKGISDSDNSTETGQL